MIYFITYFRDQKSKPVITNVNNNVVVIPYPSIKNLAIINPIAPTTVDTIARVDNTVIGNVENMSYWALIQRIRDQAQNPSINNDEILLLLNNTAVRLWNRILIQNAIVKYINTGVFECPRIWNALDVSSYPTTPIITQAKDSKINTGNLTTLQQLYPHMNNSTSISEYFENVCNEFISDITQYMNAFLSYPDIADSVRDGVIKSFKSWKDVFETRRKEIFPSERDIEKDQIPKKLGYIAPPAYRSVRIPAYQFLGSVSGITIAPEGGFIVEWTDEHLKLTNDEKSQVGTRLTLYDWPDWVIYQLAKCDKINYCLPSRFVDIIYDGELNNYINSATYNGDRKDSVVYQVYGERKYYNVITQNIMLRSMHDKNKKDIDAYNPTYIASIVAICPYIISTLVAVKNSTSPDQNTTLGYNAIKMIDDLIIAVKSLYNEFISHAPFIPFMSEVAGSSSSHIYGEVLDLIHTKSAESLTSSEYTKMSWANKFFFNNIGDIAFPVYSSKNQFEDIEKYADDKIRSSAFNELYETNKQLIGKNAWMCLIAKNRSIGSNSTDRENITKVILNSMHILSECDEKVITQFVQNIITLKRSTNVRIDDVGMLGGADNPNMIWSLMNNILDRGVGSTIPSRNLYATSAPVNPFPAQIKRVEVSRSYIHATSSYLFPNVERIIESINSTKYDYFDEMINAYSNNGDAYKTRYAQIVEIINNCEHWIRRLIISTDIAETRNMVKINLDMVRNLDSAITTIKRSFENLRALINEDPQAEPEIVNIALQGIEAYYVGALSKLISYVISSISMRSDANGGIFAMEIAESGILQNIHPFWAFPHYASIIADTESISYCMNCLAKLLELPDFANQIKGKNGALFMLCAAWIKNANAIAYKMAYQTPELERRMTEFNKTFNEYLNGTKRFVADVGRGVLMTACDMEFLHPFA